jgi:hypothetical protein
MAKSRKLTIVTAIFILSIACVVTFLAAIRPRTAGTEPGKMSPCDSVTVRELLVTAINSSPAATQNGLRLIQVGNVNDLAHSAGEPAALAIADDKVIVTTLSPFYVLYDLRVAYSHLTPATSAAAKLKLVTDRLGMKEGAGLMAIYGALMAAMIAAFETLIDIVKTSTTASHG